jgi:hypothetical protein
MNWGIRLFYASIISHQQIKNKNNPILPFFIIALSCNFAKVDLYINVIKTKIMSEKRKEWVTPQLTVLARATQQENVLQTCKVHADSPLGSVAYSDGACTDPSVVQCNACDTLGAS